MVLSLALAVLGAVQEPTGEHLKATPDFGLQDAAGNGYTRGSVLDGADEVVFYFINNQCPVSAKSVRLVGQFANSVNGAGKKVKFVGIINTDAEGFTEWQKRFDVKYPVLLDPNLETISAFGVTRAPWFVVTDKTGKVKKVDMGYSAGQLKAMNELIAKANGTKPVKLNLTDAPEQMVFGCPF